MAKVIYPSSEAFINSIKETSIEFQFILQAQALGKPYLAADSKQVSHDVIANLFIHKTYR